MTLPFRRMYALVLCLMALGLAAATPAMAAAPPNNDFAAATDLGTASPATISGTNVQATTQTGEARCCTIGHTVWWKWTSPKTGNYRISICDSTFDSVLRVYSSNSSSVVNALGNTLAESDDSTVCGSGSTRSSVDMVAFQGQQYALQVSSKGGDDAEGSPGPTGAVTGSIKLISPANDFFGDSAAIDPANAKLTGTNADATTEATEPTCCTIGHSVWYHWTPTKTGNYRVNLCDSNFNTIMRIYTGATVGTLTNIVENDDDPGCRPDGTGSRLTFIAFKDQRYEIQVSSNGTTAGPTGTISGAIDLISPANDFFADATTIAGTNPTFAGTNTGASIEKSEPSCCTVNSSVWWRWTAPTTGDYVINTCPSDFNTVLRVYTGSDVTALKSMADNDDSSACGAASDRSQTTLKAVQGTVYSIQVTSPTPTTGNISGSIAPAVVTPPPCTTNCNPQPAPVKLSFTSTGNPLPTTPLPTSKDSKGRKIVKINVKGKLGVPTGVAAANACKGVVAVTVQNKQGKKTKTVGSGRASIKSNCTYKRTISVLKSKIKGKKVTVILDYAGNTSVARSTYKQTLKLK